eukprot:m.21361 g.21361  ORF g.21361 m.21361 type:complete len:666 (+) comp7123_c0_seq2:214-2211(+)
MRKYELGLLTRAKESNMSEGRVTAGLLAALLALSFVEVQGINIDISYETSSQEISNLTTIFAAATIVDDVYIGALVNQSVFDYLLENVLIVSGFLTLQNTSVVTTARGLRGVSTVSSSGIAILNNANLRDLDLSALQFLRGNLTISNNPHLETITMRSLLSIQGTFELNDLPMLKDLQLPRLSTVGGNMLFIGNGHLLDSLCGLSKLRANGVNGSVTAQGFSAIAYGNLGLFASSFPSLDACLGVTLSINTKAEYDEALALGTLGVDAMVGTVYISWPAITSLQLSNLLGRVKEIHGDITITTCLLLTSLSAAFQDLVIIHGSLTITRNLKLLSVSASKLNSIQGNLNVLENKELETIQMSKLLTIEGAMSIQDEAGLGSGVEHGLVFPVLTTSVSILLENLPQIQLVEFPTLESCETIAFTNMNQARSISINKISKVPGGIQYASMSLITSISMANLTQSGTIRIETMEKLITLALPKLDIINGDFVLDDLEKLASLCPTALVLANVAGLIEMTDVSRLREGPPALLATAGISGAANCPDLVPTDTTTTITQTSTTSSSVLSNVTIISETDCSSDGFSTGTLAGSIIGSFVIGSLFGMLAMFLCLYKSNSQEDQIRERLNVPAKQATVLEDSHTNDLILNALTDPTPGASSLHLQEADVNDIMY